MPGSAVVLSAVMGAKREVTETWGCADTSIQLQQECVFEVSAFPVHNLQRFVLQTGLRKLRLPDEMRLRRVSGSS